MSKEYKKGNDDVASSNATITDKGDAPVKVQNNIEQKLIKIKVWVSLHTTDAEEEIDVEIIDGMSGEEIEEVKEQAAKDWMFNQIDWGWSDL